MWNRWGKRKLVEATAEVRNRLWRLVAPWIIWRPSHHQTLHATTATTAHTESGLSAAFGRYTRAYFQRWLVIGALIGVVAGVGAILFATAIALCTHWFLGWIVGFTPPDPAGEGTTAITPISRLWLLPVVTTLGGLLTGLIVFTLAPEAEGHGTDAAIEAFHEKGGRIRGRIPLVKMVASAITIGSGGSAGREGPTAQISAGFGSWLADVLHLDEHDRRIAMAAGIGSGIGAIFKAPFGGALLSAEVLYKRDFEADALFPSFVASAVGFVIYGAWVGWTPVFGPGAHYEFTQVSSLVGYLILGVCAGLVGLLYPKSLYGIRSLFHHLHLPNHVKPAIGGLLVGLIGLFIPQALGMGYGYVQFGVNSDYTHIAAWLMLVLVFVKILTTSLTIGSGGSGGVFGPGMVIGGFLGGALWAGLHTVAPGLVAGTNAGAFVVVGMGAFFGGIAKAPLAVILMVAEMTGEYALIAPAMLATMVAYVVTGDTSIYESQVPTRLDSPAHKDDYTLPLLQSLTVRDAMVEGLSGALAIATPDTPLDQLATVFQQKQAVSVPIVEQGRLVGVVSAADLGRIGAQELPTARARQVMSRRVLRAYPDESLYQAWLRMTRSGVRQLAVVNRAEPDRLVGVLTARAIAQLLRLPTPSRAGDSSVTRRQHASATTSGVAQQNGVQHPPVATEGTGDVLEPSQSLSRPVQRERSQRAELAEQSTNGQVLTPTRERDPLATTHVVEVMLTTPRLIRDSDPLFKARELLEERGAALLVVDDQGRLVAIITRSDLRDRKDREHGQRLTVGDVAVRNLVTIRPDDSLYTAVRRMSRFGLRQLPVVDADLPTPPVGMLRRSDVLAVYEHDADGSSPQLPVPAREPETLDDPEDADET
jgi:CIC family chloride channel protein